MVQRSTCETPLFLNYDLHPLPTPDAVAGEGSSNSDWLALKREAIVMAKDIIQSAIDTELLEAD